MQAINRNYHASTVNYEHKELIALAHQAAVFSKYAEATLREMQDYRTTKGAIETARESLRQLTRQYDVAIAKGFFTPGEPPDFSPDLFPDEAC